MTYPRGFNNNGQVVGEALLEGSTFYHAFLYSSSILDLGTLGGYSGEAYAINDNGQVVGWATTADHVMHAFLYSGGSMLDLNSLIVTNSGWTLQVAAAINDDGQIAGHGINPSGQTEAFLLTPIQVPEPGTWSLLALGAGVLVRSRRFHRRSS